MLNPDEVNKATESLLKAIASSDDDCGNRLMLLRDGTYEGLEWEARWSNLAAQRHVATWILAQREELRNVLEQART